MKISINNHGVYINGAKIDRVTRVDIHDINLTGDMEVVLHILTSEIEVDYRTRRGREETRTEQVQVD